jgi:hypothetical protein
MWILKVKLKHDCTIGARCEKFGCMSYSLSLSAWHDKEHEYTAQKHQIFGPPQQVHSFLLDLKTDSRIFNLKTLDSQVYFIEKRLKKEVPSSFYNPNLFFIRPVFVDIYGWEIWELASREKVHLEKFLEGIKRIKNIEIKVEYLNLCKIKNTLLKLDNPGNIEKRTEGELDQRLTEQLKTGHIEGDQWFRDFQDWLVIAFNNPYHFRYSNSEIYLVLKYREEISPIIKNHLQIFYGVGVGETEIELIRWQLEESKYLEIVGIDINGVFLELFLENLKNKQIEFPNAKILFKGYNTTFQNTTLEDFKFTNSKFKKKIHICLGGTIGNFRHQGEIWSILKRNTEKGDKLLLGFQLDTHIKEAFEKYKNNKYYPKFVLNYFDEPIDPTKIEWKIDRKTGFILMNYKGIEVFRTKKYDFSKLIQELKNFGFSAVKNWVDEHNNSCLAIFERSD